MGEHDAGRHRLNWRICGAAKEVFRSFATVHGVSEAALVDALVHTLATAEVVWLQGVVGRARAIDHQRRRRVRQAELSGPLGQGS
jgi:hypothetical protein